MNIINKNIFCIIMILSALCAYAKDPKKVFISQTVAHIALDRTTSGIIDGLKGSGFQPNKNLTIVTKNAQDSTSLAAQIASQFIAQDPDIVVGVGTLSAQSFLKYIIERKTMLIFSSVTDPISASLLTDLKKIENVSGVSNFVPLEPQLNLFLKLQPSLKKLGFLYNPSAMQSVFLAQQLDNICPALGLTLVKQTINNTNDVTQAVTKLSKKADAIFISNDNTALSALPNIIYIATKNKIPVYVSDTDAVQIGALAALGPDQYNIGLQTGKMIARILQGEDIKNIPVEFPLETKLYVNFSTAEQLGITIPKNIRKTAIAITKEKL